MTPCTCFGLPCGKRRCPVPSIDERAVHFAAWAHELDRFPVLADIAERFGVDDDTAQRWRRALANAYGLALREDLGGAR